MRKAICLQKLVLALLISFPFLIAEFARAELGTNSPQLRGVVIWPGQSRALLERVEGPFGHPKVYFLAPGERENQMQVTKVLPDSAVIQLSSATDIELKLPSAAEEKESKPAACSIQLEKARLDSVLAVYQMIADRTLLRPTQLPECEITLPLTRTQKKFELLQALDRALAEQGISVQSHLDKFALVGRGDSDFAEVRPDLFDTVAGMCKHFPESNVQAGLIKPGMINFPKVELNQVLVVFQELIGLSIIRPSALPAPVIHLHTQTEMTRVEACYAFAAVLALNGISIRATEEKYLLVYATPQAEMVESIIGHETNKPGTNAESKVELRFPNTQLVQVAQIYAELVGRPVEIATNTPQPLLRFEPLELTKAEAIRGLELLLRINGLWVIPNGNAGYTIVPAAEARHLPGIPSRK